MQNKKDVIIYVFFSSNGPVTTLFCNTLYIKIWGMGGTIQLYRIGFVNYIESFFQKVFQYKLLILVFIYSYVK